MPAPLEDIGHINPGVLLGFVRATHVRPIQPPAHRESPSANSAANTTDVMYVSCESPSDTLFVHIRLIPGMTARHPSAGSRPCRALSPLTCALPYPSAFFGSWARSPLGVSLRDR
jgi:hypothetical protein